METLVSVLLELARNAGPILGESSRTKGDDAYDGCEIGRLGFRAEGANLRRPWPLQQ